MPERFDVLNRRGVVMESITDSYPTVGWLDDRYEVRFKVEEERMRMYTVLCSPADRQKDKWSYTNFTFSRGELDPHDADVVLSPYHLVLFYELVANHNPT